MNDKRSNRSKKKTKGSAPQEKKESIPDTKGSTTNESTNGLALDKVNDAVRNADLPKYNHFFADIKFDYKTKGTKASTKTVKTVRINPLPTNAVLQALVDIWDINNPKLIHAGFKEAQARFYSGSTIKELMLSLESIVPDNYEPIGKVGGKLKSSGAKRWKLKAIGKEAVNRRMKELVATGEVVIFSFDGKMHFVPISKMVSDITTYVGSVHHIEQIKRHLHDTAQWLTLYRDWFITKFPIPIALSIEEFDDALSLKNEDLRKFWDGKVFDINKLNKHIEQINKEAFRKLQSKKVE